MKPATILPPIIALAIVAGWVGTCRKSISSIESSSTALRKRIGAAHAAKIGKPARGKSSELGRAMDWRKLVGQLEDESSGFVDDMRTNMRFEQRVASMSEEELLAAFDEIAALDIFRPVQGIAPREADGAAHRERSATRADPLFRSISGAIRDQPAAYGRFFSKWAEKDIRMATAWLDQQIAAGKFESKALDGKSPTLLQFEGTLIKSLFTSDPEAAGKRLGALPEGQRVETLQRLQLFRFNQVKLEDQKAFAKLVRDQLPENQQGNVLAQLAATTVQQGGYPAVDAFLNRIEATPTERGTTAETTAGIKLRNLAMEKNNLTSEDIDSMRGWVDSQAPGTADSTTGKALANATQGEALKFEDAAALALQYYESTSNDDVLVSFLGSVQARQHKEYARSLAGKIADETRRTKVLENLK